MATIMQRGKCQGMAEARECRISGFYDFVKKYGHPFSENPVPIAFSITARFFEGIGIAVHGKIVDIDLLRNFWDVNMEWKKVKPIAEGLRKESSVPEIFEWFEYLCNETKKREQ